MKHVWGCLALGGCLMVLIGCSGSEPPIESYTVRKTHSESFPVQRAGPDRMLAAVLVAGDQAWFWKVAGPKDEVDRVAPQFDQLLQSHLPAEGSNGPPFTWDLPEGWTADSGDAVRAAQIHIDDAPDIEVSLTPLPLPEMDYDQYLLINVNRWHRQLGLPPIGLGDLPDRVQMEKVGSLEIARVDLQGKLGDSATPPFAGRSGPPVAAPRAAGVPSFDVPEGWKTAQAGGMRKAAFQVVDGQRRVEITLIDLGPQAGDVLSNVNRWRQQVMLDPIDASELQATSEELTIDGHPALWVELANPESTSEIQAISGVILPASGTIDGKIWFITMKGDLELAARERDHFRAFVSSLEF